MPELQEPGDDPATPSSRRGWLAGGLVLAGGATAAVFFTDDPLYLRVALLAVCWAFVIAAFLAGSRRADQVAAAGREAELRHAYELELEREVAARHEHQLQLESRLRQEAEQGMRDELTRLRSELAGLSRLEQDLAAVTELRSELAALTEIRSELAGLGQVRAELAGLAELRADLGRMRSELTEQLSGELLVERMVMRAQSVRGPAQPSPDAGSPRTLDVSPWESPAVAWDVDHWESTRVDLPAPGPAPAEPAPRVVATPPPVPPRAAAIPPVESDLPPRPPSPLEWLVEESVLEPWVEPRPRSPLQWLGDRALLDDAGQPTGELPVVPAPAPSPPPVPTTGSPRRHRRAAEPDDEDDVRPAGRRRSHAAAEETVPSTAAADQPAWATWTPPVSSAEPPVETPWWETSLPSTSEGTSTGTSTSAGSSWEPAPSWATPSPAAAEHEVPSWESSSYRTHLDETPSWEAPSHEAPSWTSGSVGTTTAGDAPSSGTSWSGGPADDLWSTPAWSPAPAERPTATPSPAAPAPEPPGHARLEQILAQSGVEAPSGGRSRRRRYREEGEDAGDDVLARVLGQR